MIDMLKCPDCDSQDLKPGAVMVIGLDSEVTVSNAGVDEGELEGTDDGKPNPGQVSAFHFCDDCGVVSMITIRPLDAGGIEVTQVGIEGVEGHRLLC